MTSSEYYVWVGNVIQNKRVYEGMSRPELSRLTGIPKATLYRIEKGIGMLTLHRAKDIAEALNFPMEHYETK